MIIERILQKCSEESSKRPLPRLSAFNAGKCLRSLWYVCHEVPPEPLPPRTVLLFRLGDSIEKNVLDAVESTGIDFTATNDRREDNLDVPGLGFRARSDFIFSCPEALSLEPLGVALEPGEIALTAYTDTPPQQGEICGGEIKSMSNFAYERAQNGQLDDTYLAQIECGLRALDCRWWCCIAYRKETSHHCEVWVARNDERWATIQRNVELARGDTVPDRPYQLETLCSGVAAGACVNGKTPGRGLPHKACNGTGIEPNGPFLNSYPCGFCSFKSTCWGELELGFKNGKPRWKVK